MSRRPALGQGRRVHPVKQAGRKKNKPKGKFGLKTQVKRLRGEMKGEMKEIRKEQAEIKEGQRQVRAKFEAIEQECEILRRETIQIVQESHSTQLRLGLMFRILKARQRGDFIMASLLTQLLGELPATNECSSVGSNVPTQQSNV